MVRDALGETIITEHRSAWRPMCNSPSWLACSAVEPTKRIRRHLRRACARQKPVTPKMEAQHDLVVEDAATGFCGAVARDRERLAEIRARRAATAQSYFTAHAAEWDRIRRLHVTDEAVEAAVVTALGERPLRSLLDLGTGTGRMLELFGPAASAGLASIFARHAGARAGAGRPRRPSSIAACGRATSTISMFPRHVRRRDGAPGPALPGRWRPGVREAARVLRPPAGCSSSTSPRTSSNSCETNTHIGGLAFPGDCLAMDGQAGLDLVASRPAAGAGIGRQDRGVALARP